MTPRERFILALERKSFSGRVPHFELVFFLTMEAFGKVHPLHRIYEHWFQMKELERQLQFITHGEFAGGGTLSFDMKNKPLIHRELVQMTCRLFVKCPMNSSRHPHPHGRSRVSSRTSENEPRHKSYHTKYPKSVS